MSVVKRIVLGSLLCAVVLVAVGLLLPRERIIERSAFLNATAPNVYALLNGFRTYEDWWPWIPKTEGAAFSTAGPEFGVGATLNWVSDNPQIGDGYQEIITASPYGRVISRLHLGGVPSARVEYEIAGVPEGVDVQCRFVVDLGRNPIRRYIGLMYERWLDPDLEAGLADLASAAEALPRVDWTDIDIEIVTLEPLSVAYVPVESEWDAAKIGQAFTAGQRQVSRYLGTLELEQSGPPVALSIHEDSDRWQFEVGIPVLTMPEVPPGADSPVQFRQLEGGRVAKAVSQGSYANISANWQKLRTWIVAHGFENAGRPWEEYVSDPSQTPEAELITNLYVPVR